MTNTPAPLDPIAQLIAKYQSNGHQLPSTQQQPVPRPRKRKGWTGFRGKTLWDWLNLFGVFLIPIVIAVGSVWFSVQQNATSQTIATDQQRAITLKTYMDDMTGLLLHEGLRESKEDAAVRVIARAKTLTALSQLDGERKGTLIRFLNEAQLIGYIYQKNYNEPVYPIISLTSADLSGANLSWAHMAWGASLNGVDLSGANLNGTSLIGASLTGVDLSGADLRGAKFGFAQLNGANLNGANLSGADLIGTNLIMADLRGAHLVGAHLSEADLGGANLSGAIVTPEQLAQAYKLVDSILPDGSHYPSRSYPIHNHQEPTNWKNAK